MNEKIDVLDHGFVRLVDHMGGDLSVVRAARVSYDADWRAGEDQGGDEKLLRYLWSHGHTTPFEAVTLTFEVYAPIFIFRQWHRHRTWSFNELSARYRNLPEVFYVPAPETIGQQSASSKQAREMTGTTDAGAADLIRNACATSFINYRILLARGVPREIARSVLPVATYSHMFVTVNLLNLLKFLTLRTHLHAQWEIQMYAHALKELASTVAPICLSAWNSGLSE